MYSPACKLIVKPAIPSLVNPQLECVYVKLGEDHRNG